MPADFGNRTPPGRIGGKNTQPDRADTATTTNVTRTLMLRIIPGE